MTVDLIKDAKSGNQTQTKSYCIEVGVRLCGIQVIKRYDVRPLGKQSDSVCTICHSSFFSSLGQRNISSRALKQYLDSSQIEIFINNPSRIIYIGHAISQNILFLYQQLLIAELSASNYPAIQWLRWSKIIHQGISIMTLQVAKSIKLPTQKYKENIQLIPISIMAIFTYSPYQNIYLRARNTNWPLEIDPCHDLIAS